MLNPAGLQPKPLPVDPDALLRRLEALKIPYTLHEHKPVFTVAESEHLKKDIPGLHCRNLFLRDKKKSNFLVVAANDTLIDLRKLQDLLGCDRLSFGSPDRLWEYLGVRPGSVCPFAIINDKNNDVEIILDSGMMDAEIVCYHPMENYLTVGLAPGDLVKFVKDCHHEPRILDLRETAPDKKETA